VPTSSEVNRRTRDCEIETNFIVEIEGGMKL